MIPAAEYVERVGSDCVYLMICAIHDELYTCCYLAEFPDYELVAYEVIVMRNMCLKIFVSKIREISYNNIRASD